MSIELDDIGNGFSRGKINLNFEKIEQYINDYLLHRDGVEAGQANQMELPLDMNGFPILNSSVSSDPTSLVNKEYVDKADTLLESMIASIRFINEGDLSRLSDAPVTSDTGTEPLSYALNKRATDEELQTLQSEVDNLESSTSQALLKRLTTTSLYSELSEQNTSLVVYTKGGSSEFDGQEGIFRLEFGDFTSHVDADPLKAIYVPSSLVPVSTACWVRQHNGELRPEWFLADPTGQEDCGPATRAMFALGKFLGITSYVLKSGARYRYNSPDPSDPNEARAVYVTGLTGDIFIVGNGATILGYNDIRSGSAQSVNAAGAVWRFEGDDLHVWDAKSLRTDLSNIASADTGVPTIGAIDIVGFHVRTDDDCYFDHGVTTPSESNKVGAGGGDQSLFLSSCPSGVIGGHFRGAPDLGVYISAIGSQDIVVRASFEQCLNAIGLKRFAGKLILDSVRTLKCKRVVYTPTADGSSVNNGRQIIVNGGFFKFTEEWVIDASGNSAGSICTGAVIEDYGRRIYDGGPLTDTGDYVSAIRMRAPHCQVYGNTIRMVDWPPTGSGSDMAHLGIELAYDGNNGAGADYSQAYGNTVIGTTFGVRVATNVKGAREWGNELSQVNSTQLINEGTGTRGLGSQGTYQFTSGASANVYITSAGDFQRTTSARKYKTDEQPLDDGTYLAALKLEPKTYRSLSPSDDPQFRFLGFIADEAEELGLESLVIHGGEGEVEGFAYERMSVIHQKAIQELLSRVSELERKLSSS